MIIKNCKVKLPVYVVGEPDVITYMHLDYQMLELGEGLRSLER